MILLYPLLGLTLSFGFVYFGIPISIKISKDKNLVDFPKKHSSTTQLVPNMGGLVIFFAFLISFFVSSEVYDINGLKSLFAGICVMVFIGLIDDIIEMSVALKLLFQFISATYLVLVGNFRLDNFHGIFGIYEIAPVIGAIISIVIIIFLINAFNLIDGIDGLAGGIGLLISSIYSSWFFYAGDPIYVLISFTLSGSLLAFLGYNVSVGSKIFMGNTGSLLVGMIIAVLTIHFNNFQTANKTIEHGLPALSLAIVLFPVTDTLRIFFIRIAHKRWPFKPDKNHIHHKLLELTGNHLTSSLIIIAVNGLIIWISFLSIDKIGNNMLFSGLIASGLILAGILIYLLKWKTRNKMLENKKSIFAFSIFTKNLKN